MASKFIGNHFSPCRSHLAGDSKSGVLVQGGSNSEKGKRGGYYFLIILGPSGRQNVHLMLGKGNFQKTMQTQTGSFAEDEYHDNKRVV